MSKSKNQLRRERQKLAKQQKQSNDSIPDTPIVKDVSKKNEQTTSLIAGAIDIPQDAMDQFKNVFQRFASKDNDVDANESKESEKSLQEPQILDEPEPNELIQSSDTTISKKEQRKLAKVPLSILKASSSHPELVEWYDVDAKDPFFLVNIKSNKNTIPVPQHWQLKREYLTTRRDKKPFKLPPAIEATGIAEMRDTSGENEKSLKEQQRAKVRPKLNSLDLDYQRMYDAFFKHQTKPNLYAFGEVYFEGKEFEEADLKRFRPGVISEELIDALGLSGAGSVVMPWVVRMNQLGQGPPSYPDLKIPGWNAPVDQTDNGEIVEIGKDEELGIRRELFGKLVAFDDDEDEDGGEEEPQDEEDEENEDSDAGEKIDDDDGAVVVPESEIRLITNEPVEQHQDIPLQEVNIPSDEEDVDIDKQYPTTSTTETPIEPKKLYQILKEKFIDGSTEPTKDGLLTSAKSYDLGGVKREANNEEQQENKSSKKQKVQELQEEEEDDDEEEDAKFKF